MFYKELKDSTIEMGIDDSVTLAKIFGPTIFARIRITPILERGGWVIERLLHRDWIEVCVLPAQVDADFSEEGLKNNE